jgi:hypothetical protein
LCIVYNNISCRLSYCFSLFLSRRSVQNLRASLDGRHQRVSSALPDVCHVWVHGYTKVLGFRYSTYVLVLVLICNLPHGTMYVKYVQYPFVRFAFFLFFLLSLMLCRSTFRPSSPATVLGYSAAYFVVPYGSRVRLL